jgi:hypothetical protein
MNRPKRKVGRPGREPTPGERVGLSLRVTPDTKRALDTAAECAGRSLSQEAELRLEQSFRNQDLLFQVLDIAYGQHTAALLILLGEIIRQVNAATAVSAGKLVDMSQSWINQPESRRQVLDAIRFVQTEIDPGEAPPEDQTGREAAAMFIQAALEPGYHPLLELIMPRRRQELAPLLDHLRANDHAR